MFIKSWGHGSPLAVTSHGTLLKGVLIHIPGTGQDRFIDHLKPSIFSHKPSHFKSNWVNRRPFPNPGSYFPKFQTISPISRPGGKSGFKGRGLFFYYSMSHLKGISKWANDKRWEKEVTICTFFPPIIVYMLEVTLTMYSKYY